MQLIEGVSLSNMCDYSFGDQASIICGVYGGFMKPANATNIEFISKLFEISNQRDYMTLFIDNIRLYKRKLELNPIVQKWVDDLMDQNDLLVLCSKFPKMKFIIFTNLEDTSIDSSIEGKIPENVISIHAVNAIYNNNKIIPLPYGVQRKFNPDDNRVDIMLNKMNSSIIPNKLLYINHNVGTNSDERGGINELFIDKSWATVDCSRIDYNSFLSKIEEHKFMICPIGAAIDCHRNWEVLYMRRVPIMKNNDYLEKLFKGFPVLFVKSYSDITEELLIKNEDLYLKALDMNLEELDLDVLFQKCLKKILN